MKTVPPQSEEKLLQDNMNHESVTAWFFPWLLKEMTERQSSYTSFLGIDYEERYVKIKKYRENVDISRTPDGVITAKTSGEWHVWHGGYVDDTDYGGWDHYTFSATLQLFQNLPALDEKDTVKKYKESQWSGMFENTKIIWKENLVRAGVSRFAREPMEMNKLTFPLLNERPFLLLQLSLQEMTKEQYEASEEKDE